MVMNVDIYVYYKNYSYSHSTKTGKLRVHDTAHYNLGIMSYDDVDRILSRDAGVYEIEMAKVYNTETGELVWEIHNR